MGRPVGDRRNLRAMRGVPPRRCCQMRNFFSPRRSHCAYPSPRSQFKPFRRRARTEPEGGAMNKNAPVVLVLVLAAGFAQEALAQVGREEASPPPMDPNRKVSRQVCTRTIQMDG